MAWIGMWSVWSGSRDLHFFCSVLYTEDKILGFSHVSLELMGNCYMKHGWQTVCLTGSANT